MITGKKKVSLTRENVLLRISTYDIFKYYMPNDNWSVNNATISPFREEKNPSFVIGNRGGNLSFIDFADTSYKGDCFTFVKKLYNLDSMDAILKMIDSDFGLGISEGKTNQNYKKITKEYKQPEAKGKRYALVQCLTRSFTGEELAYWNEFHQDISDLKREQVYSVSKVYLNKKLFTLSDTELRFGYFYDGHWKIYRPFANKKVKWVPNNVPITHMEGKENIINVKNAVINKSKKDYMVMKKVYPHTCAIQNEGEACFSAENLQFLKANSDIQTLSFDSDVTGVKNSLQITKKFDFGYVNTPRMYLRENIKDWAELGRMYGLDTVEACLKEKGITI
jgi:hypothetical protein